MPSIAVITITMNRRESLQKAVESVLSQEEHLNEYIIQDALSTDGTAEYISSLNHPKISWKSEKDKGISDALNKALTRVTSDWIVLLHSDDSLLPGALQSIQQKIKDSPETTMHAFAVQMVSSDGKSNNTFLPNPDLIHKHMSVPHTGLVVSRKTFEAVGAFDTNIKIAMDYHWLQRAVNAGFKVQKQSETIQKFLMTGVSSKQYVSGRVEVLKTQLSIGKLNAAQYLFYFATDLLDYTLYKAKRGFQKLINFFKTKA